MTIFKSHSLKDGYTIHIFKRWLCKLPISYVLKDSHTLKDSHIESFFKR